MKRDKSPKAQKVLKQHGNEEQTNISVYHMLPEDKSNNETHPLASTELSRLENLGFHSPKLDYHQ